jgi:hypothetical protein
VARDGGDQEAVKAIEDRLKAAVACRMSIHFEQAAAALLAAEFSIKSLLLYRRSLGWSQIDNDLLELIHRLLCT